MFWGMLVAVALSVDAPDLLTAAIERFRRLDAYQVTIRSRYDDGEEQLHYIYAKPGFVRIEFIRPHAGAVLIYDPITRRVRLWPFGVGRFPQLTLRPSNPLIRSPRGQRIDQSDVGTLLANVRALARDGRIEYLGETRLHGRAVRHLVATGDAGVSVAGVHRYSLWLDAETLFPVRVISSDLDGRTLETVRMEDAELNPPAPKALFNP